MQLCIFEDNLAGSLEPLIYTRGVFDLICGSSSLKEKILRCYPGVRYSLHCRDYIVPIIKEKNPGISINQIDDDSCLFINSRVIADNNFASVIPLNDSDKIYIKDEIVIAARLSGNNLREFKRHLNTLPDSSLFPSIRKEKVEVRVVKFIWDIFKEHNAELITDLEVFRKDDLSAIAIEGVHLINKENIFLGANTIIKPGVVLDASNGPIYIGSKSVVYPNSVIIGPVYIGNSTLIKSLAKIYENVSIGDVCKVGGEVEDAIIMSYSNKQHDGFIGHAYLGSWINLGADTNCSDLRNNYGFVKSYVQGELINTKTQFLGLIMGDHSKSGINTMFNTGSVVGVSCNIYGSGFLSKNIPSFTWGGKDDLQTYEIEKCLDTAKVVMARRKIEFTKSDEALLRKIFEITKNERMKIGLTA
jgi:UDP-N-acetylglucosamine diphosphorylase/glucosamine-1-phosphate N-acetyltransferase